MSTRPLVEEALARMAITQARKTTIITTNQDRKRLWAMSEFRQEAEDQENHQELEDQDHTGSL